MIDSTYLMQLYDAMLAACGPRHWWPAKTPFEVCVGAILTQNTAWKNVERAIDNLRSANALTLRAINNMPHDTLAQLLIPSGYFNIKARRLKNFTSMIAEDFSGSLTKLLSLDTLPLREKLLSVNGIGRETADCIVLYAAEKPIFVVDAYTRRIGSRHGLFPPTADYEHMRTFFTQHIPENTRVYNEYHALIVTVGNRWCNKKPDCQHCPLSGFLPAHATP